MTPDIRPLGPGDPSRLGAYTLVGRIGEGGMGVVYLATDPAGQQVAVKAIHRAFVANREFLTRFRREVDAARRVPRFCTAAVLDADFDLDAPYLVTEFVDGPSLYDAVADGPLAGEELSALAVGTAAALVAIHEAGVVHRDLKPTNVLLSSAGPRVIDFGIASAVDATAHTQTGQVLGTPAYMAPEQIRGERVTAAADVFAWGGVVAYAASGEAPFGSTTSIPAVMHRILHEPPRLDALDDDLRRIVVAAMDKDPARRPTSTALVDLLHAYASRHASSIRVAEVLQQATITSLTDVSPWGPPVGASAAPTHLPPSAAPTHLPPPSGATEIPPGAAAHAGWAVGPGDRAEAEQRRGRRTPVLVAALATLAVILGVTALVDPLGWRDDPAAEAAGPSTDAPPTDDTPTTTTTTEPTPLALGDYRGDDADEAEAALRALDMEVTPVPRESTEAEAGLVVGTDPAPGTNVEPGQEITLFVGDGSVVEERVWSVFKRIGPGDFINDAQIVVVGPDGGERVVARGDNPQISADGSRIAFLETGNDYRSQVVVADPNGKNRKKITEVTIGSVEAFALSPDGSKVVYVNNTGGLFVLNADGTGRREIADVKAYELSWSPDGRQIVMRRGGSYDGLWIVGADGTGLRSLDTKLAGGFGASFPAWSPDGKLIAFDDYRGRVYVIAPGGGGQRRAADGSFPGWTPDGELTYVSGGAVYALDLDGGSAVPVEGVSNASGPVRMGSPSS